MRSLTRREPSQDTLLPNLRDLRLEFNDLTEGEEESDDEEELHSEVVSLRVMDMVESRWRPGKANMLIAHNGEALVPQVSGRRLRKVLVDMDHLPFVEEAHKRVRACRNQGLDISVENAGQLEELGSDELWSGSDSDSF